MIKYISKNLLVKTALTAVLFIIALIMISTQLAESAEVVDRVVAVVNGDIIVLTELNREVRNGIANYKTQGISEEKIGEELSDYRLAILNQLINQKLIDQEIKRYGISVADEEVDKSITKLREGKLMTEEVFAKEVKKNLGLSMEEYRIKVKDQLLRMKLINSQVQSKVVITDEDRKKYYEKFEEEFAGGKRYHLRNILLRVPSEASDSEKETALKKMEDVFEELKQGASFVQMANTYSDSSKTGEGGDLGFFKHSDLSPQLQEAVGGLGEGEFTSVLDTEIGYQIIYVEKIEENSEKSLEEASPAIDKQIYNASVNEKFQSWLMELRSRSHIEILE